MPQSDRTDCTAVPSVPLARSGPITDTILAHILAEIEAAETSADYTVTGSFMRCMIAPLLAELQQRRAAMGAIASLARPGNVVVLERPGA